ncbi:hypothetical protein ACFV97_29610 [Streptomyces sp. NPDC059913]|uniref:hypothetical protein n=1 Tax=unclassified Streptomyces TaxID=2593676 RepID=UPI00365A6E3B
MNGMSARRVICDSGRAVRTVRFGVATFRRGSKAMDRRPAGLVWIEKAAATAASL